jgi:hypothetical protein
MIFCTYIYVEFVFSLQLDHMVIGIEENKDQDIIAISKCPSEKTHVILTEYPSPYYLQRQNSFDTTTTMSYKLVNEQLDLINNCTRSS